MTAGFLAGALTTTTWRVYSAEHSMPPSPPLPTASAVRSLIRSIVDSTWWQERFADIGPITTTISRSTSVDGKAGWCSYRRRFRDGAALGFARSGMVEQVVLHELAHAVQPKIVGNASLLTVPDRYVIDYREPDDHCPAFACAHSMLTAQFGSAGGHDSLRGAYEHFEVPIVTEAELVEQRRLSELLADKRDRQLAALEQLAHERRATAGQPERAAGTRQEFRIRWGDWMELIRWQAPRTDGKRGPWSPTGLVRALRPVGRYTVSDIRAIESSPDFPDDVGMRRLGLALGVIYGQDPVWLRTGLGLFRDTCGITIEELRLLNPEWVDLVEHLNALAATRPPRWWIGGDR